ncbi:bacteriocin [Pedobacter cryoconitis]|uniref:Bacteriocin-like protein n=1 Tax=Pedobacter cryoconitis TaxID=188932 RepID=A0A7X0J5B7_9SPHI|nr:bacteriocin [Pedobacter cryoconitis]MBB6501419.1 bacteriocin-like protein [Pedobacter cryoconitis]
MKNLELKNLGVQEMNTKEMSTIEGGGVLGDLLGGLVKEALFITTVTVASTVAFVKQQVGYIFGSL